MPPLTHITNDPINAHPHDDLAFAEITSQSLSGVKSMFVWRPGARMLASDVAAASTTPAPGLEAGALASVKAIVLASNECS